MSVYALTIEDLERYWTDLLSPFSPSAGIPPDYVRSAQPPQPRQEIEIPIPAALSEGMLQASGFKPALMLAMLAAACKVVLFRHAPSETIAVLTPVTDEALGDAGSNRWLVVATTIDRSEPIGKLVERVAHNFAEGFAHQQLPFARMLELIGRTWPAHRAPLSDVAVAFEGVSRMDALDDVAADATAIGAAADGAVRIRLSYRPELFAAGTIASIGRCFVSVLGTMVASSDCAVRDVPLIAAEEAAARVHIWDRRDMPRVRVDDLVLAAMQSEPTLPAFVHGTTILSRGELVSRARALAAELRAAGVKPGDRVGLALDLGVHVPTAMLGVLLSGAAFVPLDPRHPAARLQAIVKQVAPAAILAEPRLQTTFETLAPVLAWDPSAVSDPAPPIEERSEGDDDALAYVMFTSGSTGEPSGVAISHRSLVNYLLWARDYYLGEDRPVFALYTSIAFDLTLTSIFLPLVSGCSTVVFTADDGPADINEVFAHPDVEVVKATPSHLKLLRTDRLRGTRVSQLIVGGEAFEAPMAASLQRALGPDAVIVNEYGPTEATIGCTAHRVSASDRPDGTVPIGQAIWNAGIYLLDEARRLVPDGMPGDLWIAGIPLADGYFGEPDRTSARFVDDPFNPGGRMYDTGDRVRRDTCGRLYFLGRRDEQVKFKGVRVELNDVRAAFAHVPRVRDTVVRVLEDERRNQMLVVYYVARRPIDISILRAAAADALPAELMPNHFVPVPKLPLTVNGKVDLDRLPSLEEIRLKALPSFVPPRTPTEAIVADVWREVLGIEQISVHSNFFELGGHSLLAGDVAWKISERLGVETLLRELFDAPTVAQLAAMLDERLASRQQETTVGADIQTAPRVSTVAR